MANGNLISDLTLPNRILYSTNIAKYHCFDMTKEQHSQELYNPLFR